MSQAANIEPPRGTVEWLQWRRAQVGTLYGRNILMGTQLFRDIERTQFEAVADHLHEGATYTDAHGYRYVVTFACTEEGLPREVVEALRQPLRTDPFLPVLALFEDICREMADEREMSRQDVAATLAAEDVDDHLAHRWMGDAA